jgi:hypothetical protein
MAVRDLIEEVDKEIDKYQRVIDVLERVKRQLEDVNHNGEIEDILKYSRGEE